MKMKPMTRAECSSVERPCPFTNCRHHLRINGCAESCALDVAGWGGATIAEIASLLGVSKQRAHQLVKRALHKVQILMVKNAEVG